MDCTYTVAGYCTYNVAGYYICTVTNYYTYTVGGCYTYNISHRQHGFTSARSTLTNYLLSENRILSATRDGKQLDGCLCLCGFAKAFDKVGHAILIAELRAYGVIGPLLLWMSDNLTGRRLCLKAAVLQVEVARMLSDIRCPPGLVATYIHMRLQCSLRYIHEFVTTCF